MRIKVGFLYKQFYRLFNTFLHAIITISTKEGLLYRNGTVVVFWLNHERNSEWLSTEIWMKYEICTLKLSQVVDKSFQKKKCCFYHPDLNIFLTFKLNVNLVNGVSSINLEKFNFKVSFLNEKFTFKNEHFSSNLLVSKVHTTWTNLDSAKGTRFEVRL